MVVIVCAAVPLCVRVMLSVMFCASLWMSCNVFARLVCDRPCDGGWFVCLCVFCEVCACVLVFNVFVCVVD